jgi:3-oxoacyl-[acyl-carrier protein] reductase
VITQADFHVRGFFEEIEDDEAFVDSYRAYTMSQVYVMRAVIPAMKEAGWGRYVHIGSGTAKEPVSKPPHTIANGTLPSTVGLQACPPVVPGSRPRSPRPWCTCAPSWPAT